jgi:hypothetical protein
MSDYDSPSSFSTDYTPIFTGFYGMKNQPMLPTTANATNKTSKKHKKQQQSLYPKNSPGGCQPLDRNRLEEKFHMQKQTEQNFYQLKGQIAYVKEIVKTYPYMASFYTTWLRQSKVVLKQYSNSMESPDNVSFSVGF